MLPLQVRILVSSLCLQLKGYIIVNTGDGGGRRREGRKERERGTLYLLNYIIENKS